MARGFPLLNMVPKPLLFMVLMPLLIGGSCCDSLVMGHHLRSVSQENSSKVLLSLVRAMDIPQATFGLDEGEASEGFTALEA